MNTPYIKRCYYLDKIEPFINKNLIKVLVGQRRVGKSYLLLQIIDHIKSIDNKANIIFIDKEKYEFDSIHSYTDLIEYCNSKIAASGKNYIFIDEIQDIDNFEKALGHFYSQSNIDLYCTGSNANLLSGELATVLSGRYVEIKVFSLSYNEFLKFHQLQNNNENLNKYLRIGGLPYLINLKFEDEVIYEYLQNIFTTIIYKDIITRYNIRNHVFLENLVKYLASNTGNLISAKKISDFQNSQNVKIYPQIVIDYLVFLQNAFLIFKVSRTDIRGKKVFETNEKYYFEDIGLKNVISGTSNFQINQVIENVIYNHLLIRGYDVHVGISREKKIDFVCSKKGKKLYIQATYLLPDQHVINREFGNLSAIKDNYPKLVVSLDDYAPDDVNGIKHLHLKDFLTDFEEY